MTELDTAPVILVTGSAKRIGAAIVKAAHRQNYRVIIHCHNSQSEAQQLSDELNQIRPHSAKVLIADLSVINAKDRLDTFVKASIGAFGQLDVLVHNASRFYPTPITSITSIDNE